MRRTAWFAGCSLILLAGCYVGPVPRYRVRQVKPAGLSIEEVVKMSKAGLSEPVLLEKIKSDGVAARPSADQVVSLKNEGVSEAVVAAMLTAPVVEAQTVVETVYDYPYYGYYGYYPYSYPYYYPYYPYYYGYASYPYYYYRGYPVYHATSVHTYRR